jgi:hypothetical protein
VRGNSRPLLAVWINLVMTHMEIHYELNAEHPIYK